MKDIAALKDIIYKELASLITNDYLLLDIPCHSNIGDMLIWQGEEEFLKTLPFKCLYRCSLQTYHKISVPDDVVILLHGGGNFGDLWAAHQKFRLKIIEEFPNNPIVALPQSVHYQHLGNLYVERQLMANHKHLTICARDKHSFNLLKKFNMAKDVRLVPDMAFYISQEYLKKFCKKESEGVLLLKRTDKELRNKNLHSIGATDIHDWPTFEQNDEMVCHLEQLIHAGNHCKADEYAIQTFLPHMIEVGTTFVSSYKRIYSTRLHVGILSILLNKKICFIDNSYGKISHLYDTWLKDFKDVECIDRRSDTLMEKVKTALSYIPGFLFLCRVHQSLTYRLSTIYKTKL